MRIAYHAAFCLWLLLSTASAFESEQYGKIEAGITHYNKQAPAAHQQRSTTALRFEPSLDVYHNDSSISLRPHINAIGGNQAEIDWQDSHYRTTIGDYSFLIGSDIVFWGKTDVFNPSDIINSKDYRAGLQHGQKRGMPMATITGDVGPGALTILMMPRFVPNRYPFRSSRENLPLTVADSRNLYDEDSCKNCLSAALRWEGYVGDTDIGLSYFDGTGREPSLAVGADMQMTPTYHKITQAGTDIQHIAGDWLIKAELIHRTGQPDNNTIIKDYYGATGGLEYTLYSVFDSSADAGLIGEFAYDSRGKHSHHGFQRDIFAGVRLTMNDVDDTSYLMTIGRDLHFHSTSASLSAERRLSDGLVIRAAASVPTGLAKDTHNSALEKAEYAEISLSYSF